jgi:hypothetical protein
MYMGFKKLTSALSKKGAENPKALAAWIGRKKYGKEAFAKAGARGRKGLGGGLKSKGM